MQHFLEHLDHKRAKISKGIANGAERPRHANRLPFLQSKSSTKKRNPQYTTGALNRIFMKTRKEWVDVKYRKSGTQYRFRKTNPIGANTKTFTVTSVQFVCDINHKQMLRAHNFNFEQFSWLLLATWKSRRMAWKIKFPTDKHKKRVQTKAAAAAQATTTNSRKKKWKTIFTTKKNSNAP